MSTPERAKLSQRELAAHASALAGGMLSLLRWWLDRGEKESPQAKDELFHRMVWNRLQSSGNHWIAGDQLDPGPRFFFCSRLLF